MVSVAPRALSHSNGAQLNPTEPDHRHGDAVDNREDGQSNEAVHLVPVTVEPLRGALGHQVAYVYTAALPYKHHGDCNYAEGLYGYMDGTLKVSNEEGGRGGREGGGEWTCQLKYLHDYVGQCEPHDEWTRRRVLSGEFVSHSVGGAFVDRTVPCPARSNDLVEL